MLEHKSFKFGELVEYRAPISKIPGTVYSWKNTVPILAIISDANDTMQVAMLSAICLFENKIYDPDQEYITALKSLVEQMTCSDIRAPYSQLSKL